MEMVANPTEEIEGYAEPAKASFPLRIEVAISNCTGGSALEPFPSFVVHA